MTSTSRKTTTASTETLNNNNNKNNKNVCTLCQSAFASRNQLFTHLRQAHSLDDELGLSPLDQLSGAERTAASVLARSTYTNKAHEVYYQAQVKAGVVTPHDWQRAQDAFRRPLPVAFRLLASSLNGHNDPRWTLLQRLYQLLPKKALQTCPQIGPTAQTCALPVRQWSPQAQQTLMDAQEVGIANRQELCSMIPPLLLLHDMMDRNNNNNNNYIGENNNNDNNSNNNHKDGMAVLDMCAAPGSKALQLLDLMHSNSNSNNHNKSEQQSTTAEIGPSSAGDSSKSNQSNNNNNNCGLLVCNDASRSRLMTVMRRARRVPSFQKTSTIFNCSDGRFFPALRRWGGRKHKFRHVLCDVPCSGDGTLRKLSEKEWQQWSVKEHMALHKLQVKLLARALECVEKGGRVVYSTCSLDPLEDEAVVVSAIARLGGPGAYRIVPLPKYLTPEATEPFVYSPGATSWIVPHPMFGKAPKKAKNKQNKAQQEQNDAATKSPVPEEDDDSAPSVTYETFSCIQKVPASLRKQEVLPSLFPPHARTEAMYRAVMADNLRHGILAKPKKKQANDEKGEEEGGEEVDDETLIQTKVDQAKGFGDVLSTDDIAAFQEMLPNCGRILPQHLDSGGFFCAVIERVAPAYFPVCYSKLRPAAPAEEKKKDDNQQGALKRGRETVDSESFGSQSSPIKASLQSSKPLSSSDQLNRYQYHGRILHPVESARQMREIIARDKAKDDSIYYDVYFEGQPSKELAIRWLKTHRAYRTGISEELVAPPEIAAEEEEAAPKRIRRSHVNDPDRSPLYTPMFPTPHPNLVQEFVDFFGLISDHNQAALAKVEPFPVDRLIVTAGAASVVADAVQVASCLEPSEAHTLVRRDQNKNDKVNTSEFNANPSADVKSTEVRAPAEPKVHRRRRFFMLTLVSDHVKGLYQGGAKFSPMEIGLVLCWVPIPGLVRDDNTKPKAVADGNELNKTDTATPPEATSDVVSASKFGDATSRALFSGRFGLLDEAADFLGRCATRRVVSLSPQEALRLLEGFKLEVQSASAPVPSDAQKQETTLADVENWSTGAVIAAVSLCSSANQPSSTSSKPSTLFLACVLKTTDENGSCPTIHLLAEQRLADSWKRLLQSLYP